MGYYDSEKNVKAYLEMADGYDGADLIAVLERYLPTGASVLELGMGPGKDLDLLIADCGCRVADFFLSAIRHLPSDIGYPQSDICTMKPLDLALRYMEIFFSGSDLEALRPLFADDLVFEGPFYTFDSAEAYLDALRNDPPEGMAYEFLAERGAVAAWYP